MVTPNLFFVFCFLLSSLSSSSATQYSLSHGSSLSVEKSDDLLISPNSVFSAGFHSVGDRAYCFAIWFTEPQNDGNRTLVWMANRDRPVNGRLSKLSLLKTGNLILTDADQIKVWETKTESSSLISSVQLVLYDNGNLVLRMLPQETIVWQSFESPTDTLLPGQPFTRNKELISSRSLANYSSGFYKLVYDDDNVLRLVFDGLETSSVYWYPPWLVSWQAGRSSYNNTRTAVLNSSGYFQSTDDWRFFASDYGTTVGIQRRLTMDVDGNFRLYSLIDEGGGGRRWRVSWQAIQQPCKIHGVCGPNAVCTYLPHEKPVGKRCSCLPGHRMKNRTDWSLGCEPDFKRSCNRAEVGFDRIDNVEFYGYDIKFLENYTLEMCEEECLQSCNCIGFNYNFVYNGSNGYYNCYPKSMLQNGYASPGFRNPIYIKYPRALLLSSSSMKPTQGLRLDCAHQVSLPLDPPYRKPKQNGKLQVIFWFACGLGIIEVVCVFLVWCFLFRNRQDSRTRNPQDNIQTATGFRKFTYDELKKASSDFSEEIGRGGGGIVYKGVLPDGRVSAIKRLNEANQGEAEFLAEVSTIGKVNHMNLIEIWGYCAQGKHRLLVYEFMERNSLGENLSSGALDWEKRFDIAVGSAKGLAYLHEECLEWVLHCDVKPQNILLDSNYQPKLADFGLSKLLNRGGGHNSSFSRVRGTRGYMAPEWISNLPITSKVDVYSYGVVVLEMVTGKSPTMMMMAAGGSSRNSGEMEQSRGLVKWVREMRNGNGEKEWWVEEIIDPVMNERCDLRKMDVLVAVALRCVEDDRAARPTMGEVVQMLLHRGSISGENYKASY